MFQSLISDGITPTGRDDPRYRTDSMEELEPNTTAAGESSQTTETPPAAVSVIPGEDSALANFSS